MREGRYGVEPEGSNIALVVSVQQTADGGWEIVVEGPAGARSMQLAPAQFILRMWRNEAGAIRGTIRRQGSDGSAPFQCNEQMQNLVREWLNV